MYVCMSIYVYKRRVRKVKVHHV